jgi:heptosyltransferase-2
VSNPVVHRARNEPISRILIVQTAFLGDVVLTTPLLRELRRVRPDASLCLLTTATGRSVLNGLPYVDRWLVLDKRWDRDGCRSSRGVLRELMGTPFDVAVAAHRSVRTGVILRLSGARLRVGFTGAPGAWAYNRRVPWDPGKHAVHRYLELSGALGGDARIADPQPRLMVDPAAAARAEFMAFEHGVTANDNLLCVAPGSVWPTKRWLPDGYARVVAGARRRGLVPVLVGSPEERELCRRVAALAPAPVLAGETSIPELVALLARARIVVGNDSGAAHVASAVGTPVVSVFGSTVPGMGYAAFGPLTRVVERAGLECRPCGRHGARSCPLGHFRCMTEVAADRVLARMDELLTVTGRKVARPARADAALARRPVAVMQRRPEVGPG